MDSYSVHHIEPFKDHLLKLARMPLNNQEFRDSFRLRYNILLDGFPGFCACGDPFNASCKKGGFVSKRHGNVPDLFTALNNKLCVNVETEPRLFPLEKELLDLKKTNTSPEARLDIKVNGFWNRGRTSFFYIRITHVKATSNKNRSNKVIF